MRDLRELGSLPDDLKNRVDSWRDASFTWTRWESRHEEHDPNHCYLCYACICDHRERFPELKTEHEKRGCYRHAYCAERDERVCLWVCRTCFKAARAELSWTVMRGESSQEAENF
jgi:hypothetical protein